MFTHIYIIFISWIQYILIYIIINIGMQRKPIIFKLYKSYVVVICSKQASFYYVLIFPYWVF